jgi:hypothetical protein
MALPGLTIRVDVRMKADSQDMQGDARKFCLHVMTSF